MRKEHKYLYEKEARRQKASRPQTAWGTSPNKEGSIIQVIAWSIVIAVLVLIGYFAVVAICWCCANQEKVLQFIFGMLIINAIHWFFFVPSQSQCRQWKQ